MDTVDDKEPFRGGLLSPGPSASATSVKNDEATSLEEVRPEPGEGEGQGDEKEEDEEIGNQIEAVVDQPKPRHTTQLATDEPAEASLQPIGEPPVQAGVLMPRPVSPAPRRTSSQTPFKKPPSRDIMKTSKTPSSRSIVSSSFSHPHSSSSTPKVVVRVKIHVLALSDRDNHPYHAVEPKYTCTLGLLSCPKIKEVCLHAAQHVRRNFGVVLDGSRFEARDQDGHLLSRGETISEEVMGGQAMYLIEDAVSEKEKGKERGDLSQSQGLERKGRKGSKSMVAYRTPSLSSRTSSSVKKWSRAAKSEPRRKITTAQKMLELSQTWSVSGLSNPREIGRSELLLPRASEEPRRSETSATPAKDPTVVPSAASTIPRKKWTVRGEFSTEQQDKEKTALEGVVASQQSLPSPESSPAPQDNTQPVIPDSQADPESSCPSPKVTPVKSQLPPSTAMPSKTQHKSAPQPPETQPRSAPPTRTVDTLVLANSPAAPPQSLPSRPDPYDISTVLSDDENYSPRPDKSSMPSFARKLGSSSKGPSTAGPPFASRPARNATRPSSSSIDKSSTAVDQTVIPSTPATRPPTPKRANVSSPDAPLPSSPTDHVAVAIAKGRAKASRAPHEAVIVVYDSSDDVDENLLQEAPHRFSSFNQSQPSEILAHWSGPPLQLSQPFDPFWAARGVGHRPQTMKTEDDEHTKTQLRRLGELGGSHATRIGSGKSKLQAQSSTEVSPPKASSSGPSPCKRPPKPYPGIYPLGLPVKSPSKTALKLDASKSPVIEIHGSSSETSDRVDDRSPDKWLSALDQESSPPKLTEAIVISDTSSQYESEEESGNASNKTELVVAAKRSPRADNVPLAEKLLINDLPTLPDQLEQELPTTRQETPPFSTAPEELIPSQSKAATLGELPEPDSLVDPKSEESPPSAQPSKRKWELSGEPDPEEEDRKKKNRRDERKARRQRRRKERKAQELEERVRYEEERKRLALEQAQRRARELEVTLSSPSKAARLSQEVSDGYETGQESNCGYEPSLPTPESPSTAEPAVFEGDDNNDSLSSRETEGRSSWRKLSKRYLSESPKCSQKHDQQVVRSKNDPSPSTGPAGRVAQDSQPEPERTVTTKQRFEREMYDDWAFLEEHLGRSQMLLDVHNRRHMQIMHQGIRDAMAPVPKEIAEPAAAETSKTKSRTSASVKRKLKNKANVENATHIYQEFHQRHNVQDQAGYVVGTPRSNRSAAPSPKESSAARATASEGEGMMNNRSHKNTRNRSRKKQRDLLRRKNWKQKRSAGSFKEVRHALMKRR